MSAGNPNHDERGRFSSGPGGGGQQARRSSDARGKYPATSRAAPIPYAGNPAAEGEAAARAESALRLSLKERASRARFKGSPGRQGIRAARYDDLMRARHGL